MPERTTHVLVVDDDDVTRAKLSGYLEAAGHQVSECVDGEQMRKILSLEKVDVILLDINLPGEDGLDLTRFIRGQFDVGIILVTGRSDEVDRVVGLEIGADDYVTKPFNPRELVARVKSLLRRTGVRQLEESSIVEFDQWRFDTRTRKLVSADGKRVHLTGAEFELLLALVSKPGIVLARERLLGQVTQRSWDRSDRTVDVLVRRLRQKLESNAKEPELIVTAHGEGYLFAAEVTR